LQELTLMNFIIWVKCNIYIDVADFGNDEFHNS